MKKILDFLKKLFAKKEPEKVFFHSEEELMKAPMYDHCEYCYEANMWTCWND